MCTQGAVIYFSPPRPPLKGAHFVWMRMVKCMYECVLWIVMMLAFKVRRPLSTLLVGRLSFTPPSMSIDCLGLRKWYYGNVVTVYCLSFLWFNAVRCNVSHTLGSHFHIPTNTYDASYWKDYTYSVCAHITWPLQRWQCIIYIISSTLPWLGMSFVLFLAPFFPTHLG